MHRPTIALAAGLILLFVPAAWGRTDAPQTSCQAGRTLAALTGYDDPIEDAGNAPDFCGGEAVTNDNRTITIGIHAHNRSGFVPGDSYGIYLDTDLNAATGGGDIGAEYEITLDGSGARLEQWNGTSFQPTSTATLPMEWADGYGPVLAVDRAAVGNPSGFRLVMVSAYGSDSDRAPDEGTWSYTVTPLRLQATSLSHGPAVAGKAFVARMLVMRNDFDAPLDEGTIRCAAKHGATALTGTGSFKRNRVNCAWRLPSAARGKRLAATMAVAFQGVQANRSFSVTVH